MPTTQPERRGSARVAQGGSGGPGAEPPVWHLIAAIAVVFAVALALRLAHLAALRAGFEGTSLFSMTRGDATIHWREAREILSGNPWLADRIPWKAPGYSYFLAALIELVGPSPGALRWPLAVLGALNCALLVPLARRVTSTGWSCAAGLIAALNGAAILFDGELLQPTLLIALSLPALWLLGRPAAGPAACALAGLLCGLAAVVHPVYLLPAVLCCAWLVRRSRRAAAAFALATALAVAPVTLTNVFVRGQPILISWNGGINFYAGNQPNFDATSGNRTNAWGRIMQTPVDAGLSREVDRDRLYYRLAVRQFAQHPVLGTWLLLRKAAAVLSPVEYASNIRLYELRDYSPVLRLTLGRRGPLWWPLGVVAPWMLLGLWASRDRWSATHSAIALWSVGLIASMVLFFTNARYRMPVVFVGSIWAAGGVAELVAAWRSRSRPRLVRDFAIVGVAAAGLAAIAAPQHGLPLPLEWDQAASLAAAGNHDAAERWVGRALARAGDDPALRHAAAAFYFDRGDAEHEREQLRILLATPDLEPDLVHLGHEALARSYLRDGRYAEARDEAEAALAVGVDRAVWHSHPNFQLGLGPFASCWTRLLEAEIELRDGAPERGADRMRAVRRECGEAGRLGPKLLDLEVLRVRVAAARAEPQ